jgi:hypothetical protein
MSDIRLDKRDVILQPLPIENCGECDVRPATCYIEIDLRAVGAAFSLSEARYCDSCGEEALVAIHDSLPESLNEDGTF